MRWFLFCMNLLVLWYLFFDWALRNADPEKVAIAKHNWLVQNGWLEE